MSQTRHLPSIAGCAFGYCAAGCGIGSIIGTGPGSRFFPTLPAGQGTPEQQLWAFYGGTIWGMILGMAFGVAAGVTYAVLVRRARLRVESIKHLS